MLVLPVLPWFTQMCTDENPKVGDGIADYLRLILGRPATHMHVDLPVCEANVSLPAVAALQLRHKRKTRGCDTPRRGMIAMSMKTVISMGPGETAHARRETRLGCCVITDGDSALIVGQGQMRVNEEVAGG